jgi:hypothetical protein
MHLAWNFFDDFEDYDPAAAPPAQGPEPTSEKDDGADTD